MCYTVCYLNKEGYMFRFRHKTLIFISGIIWLAIGVFLLNLGLNFIVDSVAKPLPFISFFASLTGGLEEAAICLVVLGLLIGFFKGRYVLSKSVNRLVSRIKSFPEPLSPLKMYSAPYYGLIIVMMLLGMGMNFFGVPLDIRGLIDVAVGAALINGSTLYFRSALLVVA